MGGSWLPPPQAPVDDVGGSSLPAPPQVLVSRSSDCPRLFLLRSLAISLRSTILGEIFANVVVF